MTWGNVINIDSEKLPVISQVKRNENEEPSQEFKKICTQKNHDSQLIIQRQYERKEPEIVNIDFEIVDESEAYSPQYNNSEFNHYPIINRFHSSSDNSISPI